MSVAQVCAKTVTSWKGYLKFFLFSFATIVSLFSPIIPHKYLLFKTDVTVYAYNAKRNALAKVSFVRMSETK